MLRVLIIILLPVLALAANPVTIEGMLCRHCVISDTYDALAAAIQKNTPETENGEFWLSIAKTKEGQAVAQAANIKGSTQKAEVAAIRTVETFPFENDFVLLMLRVRVGKPSFFQKMKSITFFK